MRLRIGLINAKYFLTLLASKTMTTNPIIATVDGKIVGFAEFENNGHIDCFFCHHKWVGKGIGSALMDEIFY